MPVACCAKAGMVAAIRQAINEKATAPLPLVLTRGLNLINRVSSNHADHSGRTLEITSAEHKAFNLIGEVSDKKNVHFRDKVCLYSAVDKVQPAQKALA